jgi:hypothetical protein
VPLNHQDQVNLLKDILNNHQTDCCGSVSEVEQIQRLVESLLVDSNINSDVKNVLQKIQNYSQNGIHAENLNQHIESNQQQLSNWVNDINQFS